MPLTLERWLNFLEIDATTLVDLDELGRFLTPHLDWLLDRFYDRLRAKPETAALVPCGPIFDHVRAAHYEHWSQHVFVGNFDGEYFDTTQKMGYTHFRSGIDATVLSAAYCFVLSDVSRLIVNLLADDSPRQKDMVASARKAVFLDLGITAAFYHEAQVAELESMTQELLLSLARAGEYRDDQTGAHVKRVGALCRTLAVAAGQDPAWAQRFEIASRVHDLGKIGVTDGILFKPGPLDNEEWRQMRAHPSIGADIIPNHPHELIRMARRTALTHHEHWDGNGYPAGLRGEEIPLEGRLAIVCDVYDALVLERSYKKAWSRETAVEYIRSQSGRMFDPVIVGCFTAALPDLNRILDSFDASAARPAAS